MICVYAGIAESSRVKGMRLYYEKERTELSLVFAERINHVSDRVVRDSLKIIDPDRPSLADRFKEHNSKRFVNAGKSTLTNEAPQNKSMRLRHQLNAINNRDVANNILSSTMPTVKSLPALPTPLSNQRNVESAMVKAKPLVKNEYIDAAVESLQKRKLDTSNYKYPSNLNFKGLDWLFSDED